MLHPVVSVRHKTDRIQIWTRHRDEVDTINAIGKKLYKLLDLANEPTVGMEFQVCIDDVTIEVINSLKYPSQ